MLMTENLVAVATLTSTSSLPIGELVGLLDGELFENRGDQLARTAPFSPEVNEDRLVPTAPTTSSNVASVRVVMFSLINTSSNAGRGASRTTLAIRAHIPCASSQRSASIAAIQPDPAEVTAWR